MPSMRSELRGLRGLVGPGLRGARVQGRLQQRDRRGAGGLDCLVRVPLERREHHLHGARVRSALRTP